MKKEPAWDDDFDQGQKDFDGYAIYLHSFCGRCSIVVIQWIAGSTSGAIDLVCPSYLQPDIAYNVT